MAYNVSRQLGETYKTLWTKVKKNTEARGGKTMSADYLALIDALGFILGAALALRAGKGFVPIRKGGKLPVATDSTKFVDYSGSRKSLELRRHATFAGMRVLVVDEWVETGSQAHAAIQLIEAHRGFVSAIATIHIDANKQTQHLRDNYPCFQVWPDA